jgi:hypothetical protein
MIEFLRLILHIMASLFMPRGPSLQRKAPLGAGLELRGRELAYPASFDGRAFKSATTPLDTSFYHSALRTAAREDTSDVWAFRVAPAHEEPRSGSNNSEHDATIDRSTNYGSGHLIFRDIGHIFSLLFLLTVARWSPVEKEGSKAEGGIWFRRKNGFNCVSCGTHRGGRAERRLIR